MAFQVEEGHENLDGFSVHVLGIESPGGWSLMVVRFAGVEIANLGRRC
ncbi:MAG: hypothetical protein ACUVTO_07535 [Candidatus Caldatribacteriaceae bacterium]